MECASPRSQPVNPRAAAVRQMFSGHSRRDHTHQVRWLQSAATSPRTVGVHRQPLPNGSARKHAAREVSRRNLFHTTAPESDWTAILRRMSYPSGREPLWFHTFVLPPLIQIHALATLLRAKLYTCPTHDPA